MTSMFNASYFIGSVIATAITHKTVEIQGDWSRRLPSLLQLCPSMLQVCTVFLLPESPKWLISIIVQETQGRSRKELIFLFEDKALAEQSANAVEKQLNAEDCEMERETSLGDGKNPINYVEDVSAKELR